MSFAKEILQKVNILNRLVHQVTLQKSNIVLVAVWNRNPKKAVLGAWIIFLMLPTSALDNYLNFHNSTPLNIDTKCARKMFINH